MIFNFFFALHLDMEKGNLSENLLDDNAFEGDLCHKL